MVIIRRLWEGGETVEYKGCVILTQRLKQRMRDIPIQLKLRGLDASFRVLGKHKSTE